MDKDGSPLSFAVPRGAGGVFERLFAGDIDWKAALVWLMLKLHSDWTTGITDKNCMATLAKWVGFSKQNRLRPLSKLYGRRGCLNVYRKNGSVRCSSCIPSHIRSGLSVNAKSGRQRSPNPERCGLTANGGILLMNVVSGLNVGTAEIQTRQAKNRGHWRPLTDRERHRMPKAIHTAFEQTLEAVRNLRRIHSGSHNAHSGSHNAHSGAYNAHPTSESGSHATSPLRL